MGTYPTSPRSAFLAWCEAHYPIFLTNYAGLGITNSQALAFKTATQDLGTKQAASDTAKFAYRTAVNDADASNDTLRARAGETVRLIRAFAEASSNPEAVYSLAQIPPPAQPSPAPPPGTPKNFTVGINSADGSIELAWKCENPSGTSGTTYVIRRRLTNDEPWAVVDVVGEKRWTDTTFTAGPDSVQYSVFAQRAGRAGEASEILTVNFGRGGGGFTVAGANMEADEGTGANVRAAA